MANTNNRWGKTESIIKLKSNAGEYQIHVIVDDIPYIYYLKVGESKDIKLYGAKGAREYSSYDSEIISIVGKTKIKGINPGETIMQVNCNGSIYNVKVIVEDITITNLTGKKNKYSLNLKVGETQEIQFIAFNGDIVFTSNKPTVAYADINGNIHALSKGKALLKTKINGKTISITVTVTE